MKKIYIAGCGGMLGEAFYKNFKNDYELKCVDIDVNENWLSHLDFRNSVAYQQDVKNFQPNYLFHLGAHTDLEYCETHQDDCYQTNTQSVKTAVSIANDLKIPLLFISTAGIFGGEKKQYHDWDAPNPLCHYAKSKYLAEIFVKKNTHRYLICRPGWMIGGGPKKDKKLIKKLLDQIKSGKKELFIVNDRLGTPTYSHDFAKNVKLLIERNIEGIYNMVCSGNPGRVLVAQELIKIINLENQIKITEVSSDFFKKEYFAPRPASEHLINSRLQSLDLNLMRDWQICLKEYINNYFTNYFN